MTTDNRTNHFTDEQVVAAAMVIDRNAFRVGEAESNAWETGRDFPSELSAAKQRIRTRKYRAKKKARAALVAAAGAAPQAESDEQVHFAPYMSATAACGEAVPKGALAVKEGDRLYADTRFTDRRKETTCAECVSRAQIVEHGTVQPSSTVDEAALIREAKAEALTDAVEIVHEEGHAFVDKMWGTVVPKLTIIEALRARAAEYRKAVES